MYGIDPNKSEKSITSSKGYCEYMDYKYYNTENNNIMINKMHKIFFYIFLI